jgi:adenylyl- and sulfurtransferase ThiI
VEMAKGIDTYTISIIPNEELLPGFTPRSPATGASVSDLEKAEQRLPVTEMIHTAITSMSTEEFRFRGGEDRGRFPEV